MRALVLFSVIGLPIVGVQGPEKDRVQGQFQVRPYKAKQPFSKEQVKGCFDMGQYNRTIQIQRFEPF
jgi:hypothetical protein